MPCAARGAVILLVTGHCGLRRLKIAALAAICDRRNPLAARAPMPCIGENGLRASLSKGRLFASPWNLTPNT